MFNKIPKWVRDFPYEMDRTALTELAKASKGPFDKPREMNFALYGFKKEKDIEGATQQIESNGWKCAVYPQSDDTSSFVLEAQKQGYVVSEERYVNDTAFFNRLAVLYKVEYDGWYASN